MSDLLPGESLSAFQARMRQKQADSARLDQLQEIYTGQPVDNTPKPVDIATRPYEERSTVARGLGAPVDLVNEGLKAVGVPVSNEPFMGSRSIDRFSRLTADNIAQTPASLMTMAGVVEGAAKYLADPKADATFQDQLFTPEGKQAYEQAQADIAQRYMQANPGATPDDIAKHVSDYFTRTENGYREASNYMTAPMREGRLLALDTHKALGMAGLPTDATYSDDAMGILGSSLVAIPAAPAAIGGKFAESVVGQAVNSVMQNTAAKTAVKAAELLTPVTIPATKGAIAANAAVGLASNEAFRAVAGQAALSTNPEAVYKEEAQRVAATIDSTNIAGPSNPTQEPIKPIEAAWGPVGMLGTMLAGMALAKHSHKIITNTPAGQLGAQTANAAPNNYGYAANHPAFAGNPAPPQAAQAAGSAPTTTISTGPVTSTSRGLTDTAQSMIDESANITNEYRKLTGDATDARMIDASHQNLVTGGGKSLDIAAIDTGTFLGGNKISRIDYQQFMRDMSIAETRDAEKLTKYLNAKRELVVRDQTVANNFEAMQEARAVAQSNPRSLVAQNNYYQATKLYQDSIDDSNVVGRHDYRQYSNNDLRSYIQTVEQDPFMKSIAARAETLGRELLDIRLKEGLISKTEYQELSKYPYILRKMADYTKDMSMVDRAVHKIVKGLDYTTPPEGNRKQAYAGMTRIELNKEDPKEIKNFASPFDAVRVGVAELSRDLRQNTFKREIIDGLNANGHNLKAEQYIKAKHGDTQTPEFADKYIALRERGTGRVVVYKTPGEIARYVNYAPEAYGLAERVANFWRAALQRPVTGPLRGVTSLINQATTAHLSALSLAPGNVSYNLPTILKAMRYSLELSSREALSGIVKTVRAALLNTPLFRAIDLMPNGAQVTDQLLTGLATRLQSNFMHTLEEIGVSPTNLVHGTSMAGPDYLNQFSKSVYARGPLKEAYETWAKSFEYMMSGPRLAVIDNEINKQMRIHGVTKVGDLPDKVLRRAIQDGREVEGDYMRNVGSPELRKALSLIPYGRVTVQGNYLVARRISDMLFGNGLSGVDRVTTGARLVFGGIMPKLISLGLIAAAGDQTAKWYWGERTDQQRMREWHWPKKFEDLVGLTQKMLFGTPYKDVPASDFYIQRGPPDTAWIADAVVEGVRATMSGTFAQSPGWYDPSLWSMLGRWATSAAGLDLPVLDIISKMKDMGTGRYDKATEEDKNANYLGARVQDILTATLGLMGTAGHESVNTLVATKDPKKAAREFEAQMGTLHLATGASDVPGLLDAQTRYTRRDTLISKVLETERMINNSSELFRTTLDSKNGAHAPLHIPMKDLQVLKLMSDTIHAGVKQNHDYQQYDKAFDSFAAMARRLEHPDSRKQYEPQERIDLTQKLNRYAHAAADKKIAILTNLEKILVDQYGDYLRQKGYSADWKGINKLYADSMIRY